MTGDPAAQAEEPDTTNIQLGIFIPAETRGRRTAKKLNSDSSGKRLDASSEVERLRVEQGASGRNREKRKRTVLEEESEEEVAPAATAQEGDSNSVLATPRKRRKRRKKHKQKTLSGSGNDGGCEGERALQYLAAWDRDRDNWSFRKKTQHWLLQNAYDKKKVSPLLL